MALSIPQGFVFKPSDEILLTHYLKPKAMGSTLPCEKILDRNLYGENKTPWIIFSNTDPWEIVGETESFVRKEIYVFTKLVRTERRYIRVAGCGSWKGKSKQKSIRNSTGEDIGVKKSFTFKVNGNLNQDEQNRNGRWIMTEYTLEGISLEGVNHDYAVCRISWDQPKFCVEAERSLIEEMPWNHDQLNSEADLSWPAEMTAEEFLHCTEVYYPS